MIISPIIKNDHNIFVCKHYKNYSVGPCGAVAIFFWNHTKMSDDIFSMIRHGDTISLKTYLVGSQRVLNIHDLLGHTPLIAALLKQNDEMIDLLLESGASINFPDKDGSIPLAIEMTIRGNDTQMTNKLIKLGSQIDTPNNRGVTPLMEASVNGNLEKAKILINHGANVNQQARGGSTALISASCARWRKTVELCALLIKHDAKVNHQTNYGVTALLHASDTQNLELVTMLLEKGAETNFQNKKGETVLILLLGPEALDRYESFKRSKPWVMFDYIKTKFPRSNTVERPKELSPLYESIKDLNQNLDQKISIFSKYMSPMPQPASLDDLEAEKNNFNGPEKIKALKLLLDSGANPNQSGKNGETPLIIAVRWDDKSLVELLLQYGALIDTKDNSGKSAWNYASISMKDIILTSLFSRIETMRNDRSSYFSIIPSDIIYLVKKYISYQQE